MVGAGVAREAPAGRFVDGSKCVITTGINAVSESTEIGASKPALPARQSNTKLRCQSISYGAVDDGAAGTGVTTVVEARGAVVSVCTQPAKPISANGNMMRRIEISIVVD